MLSRVKLSNWLTRCLATACVITVTATVPALGLASSQSAPNDDPAALTARLEHLGAVLTAWEAYKERHIEPSGRVVDGANGAISHSEGQGYAMLIAAKLADRATFDRVWSWTWQNLGIRSDHLFAWQWSPAAEPPVTDVNNATDGDILITWALMEAADLWDVSYYAEAARMIAQDIAALTLSETEYGQVILPAEAGFGPTSRPDGPVINLSYWVFPARTALKRAAPDIDWDTVFDNGIRILEDLGTAGDAWPSEWTSLASSQPSPAEGFDPIFGYNAIRIPLYLAWAEPTSAVLAALEPFSAMRRTDGSGPFVVEATSGVAIKPLRERGFASIATLTECALTHPAVGQAGASTVTVAAADVTPVSDAPAASPEATLSSANTKRGVAITLSSDGQNYYPETLNILAALAQLEVHPECLH